MFFALPKVHTPGSPLPTCRKQRVHPCFSFPFSMKEGHIAGCWLQTGGEPGSTHKS